MWNPADQSPDHFVFKPQRKFLAFVFVKSNSINCQETAPAGHNNGFTTTFQNYIILGLYCICLISSPFSINKQNSNKNTIGVIY